MRLSDRPSPEKSGMRSMLGTLGLSFALVCFSIGTILLYDATPGSDATQTPTVIGGGFLLALGLVTLAIVAREWSKWRKDHKDAARSISN